MYKLTRIGIEGFWGKHSINVNIHEDVTIFIGKNGTGKTNFINIIQAVLSADIEGLESLKFDEVIISIKKDSTRGNPKLIKVTRSEDKISYKMGSGKKSYDIAIGNKALTRQQNRSLLFDEIIYPVSIEEKELKNKLKELINLSFLSVYREEKIYTDEWESNKRSRKKSIDDKLSRLMDSLTDYQLQIEGNISKLSTTFQSDVMKTMLYKSEFDDYETPTTDLEIDTEELNAQLSEAFSALGYDNEEIHNKIDTQIKKLKKAHIEYANFYKDPKKYMNDKDQRKNDFLNIFSILPLVKRTRNIIELLNNFKSESKKISEPINAYLEILKDFIEEKNFTTSSEKQGGLIVKKGEQEFSLKELS